MIDNIPAWRLGQLASIVVSQLQTEIENTVRPDNAVAKITAVDMLIRNLALIAMDHGISVENLPIRHAPDGRIIGAGRRLRGTHARRIIDDLTAIDDTHVQIRRHLRYAAITSPHAFSHVAEAAEAAELDANAARIAALNDWSKPA
ncbi:hypothetical protein [Gordonia humi]|uniref:Uncharacterized protein n=1 Tax=Gordonia humi TaxID=686429 RepID=A0A840EWG5_9ACTN|nr:hypothetical protein [Gordonia humi]MBB4134644.1 hypothetical protein [Gordonia humi]